MTTSSNSGPLTALVNPASLSTNGTASPVSGATKIAGGSDLGGGSDQKNSAFSHIYQNYILTTSTGSSTGTGTVPPSGMTLGATGLLPQSRGGQSPGGPSVSLSEELEVPLFPSSEGLELTGLTGVPERTASSGLLEGDPMFSLSNAGLRSDPALISTDIDAIDVNIKNNINNNLHDISLVENTENSGQVWFSSLPSSNGSGSLIDPQVGNAGGKSLPLNEAGWPPPPSGQTPGRQGVALASALPPPGLADYDALHQNAFQAAPTPSYGAQAAPGALPTPTPVTPLAPGFLVTSSGGREPRTRQANSASVGSIATVQPTSAAAATTSNVEAAPTEALPVELSRLASVSGLHDRPQALQAAIAQPLTRFVGAPGWDQGLGQRMLWMVDQGLNQAELRLDPPQLGSVSVRISLLDDQAQIMFQAQHPAAREALEAALPKLREMFAEQGLELADADISEHSDQDGPDSGSGSGNQPDSTPGLSAAASDVDVPGDSSSTSTAGEARDSDAGLIDEFV